MTVFKTLMLELTKREAAILLSAIAGYLPPKDDEVISIMLYNRILKKIEEAG